MAAPETLHATAVSCQGRAALIIGPSGSGKSALALELMARGAGLIADDRVIVTLQDGAVIASAPAAIAGRIEARFVGLLRAEAAAPAPVALIVDMGQGESERLPPQRSKKVMGITLPLVHNIDKPYFPAAILQYLKAGRRD
ncbi:HPr kinase/phosphorylase [Rhodalgimonas zhirmunskyi]|uniref:HPr kinase/phosphatase C-terminal domain-containing protein n=1 Tax=Rhodalgimonas zhirmunskyi TaxID=2964767 RepID=A0AAJ1UBX2_9RHOB|nr:HPr kinase/phosphatase C-terminal domain-containing protein [Rhodoalgimonas zhirmunskyi]MDQ2095685.1 HPr kinase/phosphatase C-terminal domain-containing protein [Rhodoalgimonas zhirmunskyi]